MNKRYNQRNTQNENLDSPFAFSDSLEETHMIPTWDNLVSLSVIGLYIIPCALTLWTRDFSELLPLGGMLLTVGLNESIKHFLIGKKSPRPTGARDCNLLVNNGPQAGRPGMPSGHSAHVSFFAGYYLQRLGALSPLLTTGLILYALLVMLSRYTKCCHTVPQLLSGSALGLAMSVAIYPLRSVLRP